MNCFHCQSSNTNKAGLTGNNKQRYYCRACRRYFRERSVETAASENKIKARQRPRKFSESHLILKLQAAAQKLGRTPTTGDINELSRNNQGLPLYVYQDMFGSFNVALKKARLKLRYNQEFDKDKLIAEMKTLRRKLKRALIARDVQAARRRGEVSSIYHFQRAFGSVPQAIAAAGAARRDFTKEEIKTYLRNLGAELKREPTGKDIASRFTPGETPSYKEVLRVFGTLSAVRK